MSVETLIERAQAPDKTLESLELLEEIPSLEIVNEHLAMIQAAAWRQCPVAVDAIHVLTCIGEDALAEGAPVPEGVREVLQSLLASKLAPVRAAAVEALWQRADRESLPLLRAALERESLEEIRETLAHVVRVLEP